MKRKLTLRNQSRLTPEIEAWLRNVEEKINDEVKKVILDMLVFGNAIMQNGKHVPWEKHNEI